MRGYRTLPEILVKQISLNDPRRASRRCSTYGTFSKSISSDFRASLRVSKEEDERDGETSDLNVDTLRL